MVPTIDRPSTTALGLNLKLERVKRGITQKEFAALIGVHRTFMGQLEWGHRGVNIVELPESHRDSVSDRVTSYQKEQTDKWALTWHNLTRSQSTPDSPCSSGSWVAGCGGCASSAS